MRRSQIVVVGSLNVDHVFSVERLPEPGETLLGKEYSIEFGGKGANQAVAAARLGAAVSFLGCIGRDTSGDAALAALAEEGIDISGVARLDETATGAAGIYVDGAGRNSIVVAPGANAAVNPVRIAAWESIIAAADCLLLQLEVPLPAVQAAEIEGTRLNSSHSS
ncbi:MAG: PfkB family carbohydrate kinase [Pseudomonadota bacterium]